MRRFKMGLTPITRIQEAGRISSTRTDDEVRPPFTVDRSGRMEDDAYSQRGEDAERGLEEEDTEQTDETSESAESSPIPPDSDSTVNFVA